VCNFFFFVNEKRVKRCVALLLENVWWLIICFCCVLLAAHAHPQYTHSRTHAQTSALDVTGNDTKNKKQTTKDLNRRIFCAPAADLFSCVCCFFFYTQLGGPFVRFGLLFKGERVVMRWVCHGVWPSWGEADTLRERAFVGFFVLLLKWYQDGRVRSSTGRDLHELLSPLFLQQDKKRKSKKINVLFFISIIMSVITCVSYM
jgi:hypothetical protein